MLTEVMLYPCLPHSRTCQAGSEVSLCGRSVPCNNIESLAQKDEGKIMELVNSRAIIQPQIYVSKIVAPSKKMKGNDIFQMSVFLGEKHKFYFV